MKIIDVITSGRVDRFAVSGVVISDLLPEQEVTGLFVCKVNRKFYVWKGMCVEFQVFDDRLQKMNGTTLH